jgi:hypothetical protein
VSIQTLLLESVQGLLGSKQGGERVVHCQGRVDKKQRRQWALRLDRKKRSTARRTMLVQEQREGFD